MINFNKETHEYFDDDKKLISVTQLLKKHGLSPNYNNVQSEILKAKSERGSIIHEELSDLILNGEIGFTNECNIFADIIAQCDLKPTKSEYIVHNDIIAGTVDLSGIYKGCLFIGDFKTTSVLHKESIRWQLSLYAYLSGENFEKFIAIHFPNEKECNIIELEPIPLEEVERLIECERNGEKYEYNSILNIEQYKSSIVELQSKLDSLDKAKKEIETQLKAINDILIEQMEQHAIKSIDNELFKITYIAPTIKTTIDSKALKENKPDIYEQFSKKSKVKANIRITLK